MTHARQVAIVTGASAGIGAASARALAAEGYKVVLGARRLDRIERLATEIGGRSHQLDVTDPASVETFCAEVPRVDLLVNNAGGAFGRDSIAEARDDRWLAMYQTNVMGTMRMTRALIDRLVASGDGMVINVGSISGFENYPGGAGYTAAKHALRALTQTLRLELLGKPVRVAEIAPGLVATEFSMVRFEGDETLAAGVYKGMTPLAAGDVAECVRWVASLPAHVNVDHLVVRPRDQATSTRVFRRPE